MTERIRRIVPMILIAVLASALTVGAPAVGAAIYDAVNADKVDGRHAVGAGASVGARAGKLVATGTTGRLPNNIIAKAPDANLLDGLDSSAFLRATGKAADAESVDGVDSSLLQRRVIDACPSGQSIKSVGADGSVACTSKAADADLLDGLNPANLRPVHVTKGESATLGLSGTPTAMQWVTLTAPSYGRVEVRAQMAVFTIKNSATAVNAWATISEAHNSHGDPVGGGYWDLPAAVPNGTYQTTLPVTASFLVSPGAHSYFLVASGSGGASHNWSRLDATFFPE